VSSSYSVLINAQTVAAFDEELLAAIKRFWITYKCVRLETTTRQATHPRRMWRSGVITDEHEQCCVLCFSSIGWMSESLIRKLHKNVRNLEVKFSLG